MTQTVTKKRCYSSDLDDTAHNVKGRGVLASRKDLDLPPSEFADGCKLLQAAAIGDLERIQAIIRNSTHRSMIDFRDYDRRTALHVAASEGHLNVCKLLVEKYKVRINRSDRWGGSPLDDAHRHCHAEVAAYLRSNGATPGSSDQGNLFIQAAAKGDLSELKMLVSSGAISDINVSDYDKRTALHLACNEGHVEVVDFLVNQPKIDVNIEDRWGTRPIDDALKHDYKEIVEILAFHGAIASLMASNHSNGNLETHIASNQEQLLLNMQVDIEELEMIDKIGGGAFGDIYKCRWKGILVAAKCIKNSKIVREKYESSISGQDLKNSMSEDEMDQVLADFRMEMAILSSLRHPNVCMLLAYSNTPKLEIMVSELAKCSLLDIFVADNDNHSVLSKKKQIIFAQQLAAGMNYLHTCKPPIIHRDLKPANLLIDHNGTLKITDFGLAKIRPSPKSFHEDEFVMTGETGSYRYMAPEVFKHQKYNETVDVFSFAMILYYLLAGKPPWHTISAQKVIIMSAIEGQRPEVNRHWDHRLGTLLRQSWDENPTARPSFGEILKFLGIYSREVFKTDEDQVIGMNEKSFSCKGCHCTIS